MSENNTNLDAAAVEAMEQAVMAEETATIPGMCKSILAAIRDGEVPTVYHISQIPGCREFESRHEKDQTEIAALRARCEASERDYNAAREAADSALAWFNRESEMRIKVEKERDAAIAAKEKAEVERDKARRYAEEAKAFRNGMHVRNYREMVAAQAEVAKKDAAIARLVGVLREARQHISDCINEEIDVPAGLHDRIVAAIKEAGK